MFNSDLRSVDAGLAKSLPQRRSAECHWHSAAGSFVRMLALLASIILAPIDSVAVMALAQDQIVNSPNIRALLIGVTTYPGLPRKHHLIGPSNDVDLLARTLRERFAVHEQRIVKLVEGSELGHLPTRQNIRREFVRMAKTAGPGDHVVIFLAGHGSQMPNFDKADVEADGLDEIFLPRDITHWNGRVGRVENAITDDEISDWTDGIRSTGAFVFFIGDFCHSGTSTRGAGPVARSVEPSQLGIPSTPMARGNEQGGGDTDKEVTGNQTPNQVGTSHGSMVALYAAQPHELAYEDSIPRGGERHGWLSWALNQILNESNETLTYRQLAERVRWHYQRQRWTRSTPIMEGSGIDREVLGQGNWPEQPAILLSKISDRQPDNAVYRINAGILQGITPGSILEVLPSSVENRTDRQVGYVRVMSVEAMNATVVPTSFRDTKKKNENLPASAQCELVYSEFSDRQLRIHVDVSFVAGTDRRASLMQSTEALLLKTSDQVRVPINIESSIESAELIVSLNEEGTVVEIARQSVHGDSDGAVPRVAVVNHSSGISLGRHALSNSPEDWLAERLSQIYRAETLRRLATPMGAAVSGVRLGSQIVIRSGREVQGRQEPDADVASRQVSRPIIVTNGDEPEITIRNRGFSPVDISVLYIAADLSITALYPDSNHYNRCQPGRDITIGGWRINNATLGWEDLIVIGVRSNRSPIPRNFSFLADPTLASVSRNVRAAGGDTLWNSPFIRLCRSTMFRERGLARGISTSDSRDVAVHRLSWKVTPQK